MKESYYTVDTIDNRSRELLEELKRRFGIRHRKLDSGSSALLILDMQRYFLDDSSHAFIPAAKAIVDRVGKLANIYRSGNLPVIYTRHIDLTEDSSPMKSWWKNILTKDDPLSELIYGPDHNGSIILDKTQYDAFFGTDLEDILNKRSVKSLVICGVMTHLCCETTARSAFMRGYDTFVCVDGTATYTEAFHRSALAGLAHGFSTPVLISDIIKSVGAGNEN